MKFKKMIIGAVLFTLLLIFIAWGPPKLIERTSTPNFCVSCHVMEMQFAHWQSSAKHRHLKCVDCHLPNNNAVNHLIWKGIDGTKDFVLFHTGIFSEPLRISGHGKDVVQQNCIRCHSQMSAHVSETANRNCWSCHRRVSHRVAPMQTRVIQPTQPFHLLKK